MPQSNGGTKVSYQAQFDLLKPTFKIGRHFFSNRMDIVLIEIEANKSALVNSLRSSGKMENEEREDSLSTSISGTKTAGDLRRS